MTRTEFAEMVKARGRNGAVGKLVKEFTQLKKSDIEDAVQIALVVASRRTTDFVNEDALMKWLHDTARFRLINQLEKEVSRRKLLSGLVRVLPRSYDPTRRLDYAIDLERSVVRTVKGTALRHAVLLVMYQGWDPIEVVPTMPTEKAQNTWRKQLSVALSAVRKDMQRGGYFKGADV